MERPDERERRPDPRGDRPDRSGSRSRRVWWLAFAASAAVHLVLIWLYPGITRRNAETFVPFLVPTLGSPGGMAVIELVEVDDAAEPERPPEPVRPEDTGAPSAGPDRPVLEEETGGAGLVAPGPTPAERLRPHLGDARVWSPIDPVLLELTGEQRAELALAGRLEAYQDSVRAAAEAARALTDWTTTDSEGRRWGVADGQLHLGGLTLPLPFNFGERPGQRVDERRRAWEWEEIRRQGATGAVREGWKERAQAIRERRDRERELERQRETEAKKAKPDTTSAAR